MTNGRDDWLMRQVDGLGEAASKLLAGALGRDIEAVDELQEEQVDGLLDDEFAHEHLRRLDVRSTLSLLRPSSRVRTYARLLVRKATITRGRPDADPGLSHRALRILLELHDLEGTVPDATERETLATLLADVAQGAFSKRDDELLGRFGLR